MHIFGATETPEGIQLVFKGPVDDPEDTNTTTAAAAAAGDNSLKTDEDRGVTRTRSGRRIKPPQYFSSSHGL